MAEPVHIALVDDDSAVLDSLQLYFARQNVKTSCFAHAEALLAALDGGVQPDCVVSDVRMPGMSGLDLQARLNAEQIRIPIIFITAHGDERMRTQALRAGAADFLAKPFDDEVLLRSVRAALEP